MECNFNAQQIESLEKINQLATNNEDLVIGKTPGTQASELAASIKSERRPCTTAAQPQEDSTTFAKFDLAHSNIQDPMTTTNFQHSFVFSFYILNSFSILFSLISSSSLEFSYLVFDFFEISQSRKAQFWRVYEIPGVAAEESETESRQINPDPD